jgi:hypothetical protein
MPIRASHFRPARPVLSLGLAIAAFFGTQPADAAVVVWQGEAVIDSTSTGCNADVAIGLATNRVVKSILRPKDIDQNGANTTVLFLANQMTMFAMVLDHGAMPAGTAAVFGNDSSGVIKANVGVLYNNFVQTPAVVGLATENVNLRGTIKDFLYLPGCNVTFRAAYSKRLD